ncbi:heat intolerant 4-like protein [Tanacetum coccineum]
MRKGTKRKSAESREEPTAVQQEEEKKEHTKPKRAKVAKVESEPEYFDDQRELEDLWKQVFPIGTEWDQLDLLFEYKWNFKNLEDAFEEGGVLHGRKVYLFSVSEPLSQMLFMNGQLKVTCLPVVVAVVSPIPPSDKIGINSVQREAEEIIDMKQMKMDWVPYIPFGKRGASVERLNSQIFILNCVQRRAGLKRLKLDRVKKFEYCLPYFYHPFREDEAEQNTVVDIMFPAEPPVVCEFDWELDELEEFANELIASEELTEDHKDEFKEFVKEKVREAKRANREAREKLKKAGEEMDQKAVAAFENMRFYKFYPVATPDTPASEVKSSFINRYYGKAHQVL